MPGPSILVTGGTGTVGRHLLDELTAQGDVHLRVLCRRSDADVPEGVQVHVGDFADPRSLREAMAGCTHLFLLTSGEQITEHDVAAAQAARASDVEHIVKLSALGVGKGAQDPITRWHRAGEDAIAATGIPTTVLRPTGFMSNALGWAWSIAATGTVSAPYPDGRTALVDPADVARVAAIALTTPGHQGRVHELTGPQALSPAEQVGILSEVLAQPVQYLPEDPATTRSALERHGMTSGLAAAVVALLASAEEPFDQQPLATVEQVTGRAATSFRDWAHQHRAAFTTAAKW